MSGNLQKLVQAEGIFEILDFEFIPWGNAYYNTSECGRPLYPTDNETWSTGYNSDAKQCWIKQCQADKSKCFASDTVVCQHGYNECAVDTIEALERRTGPRPLKLLDGLYDAESGLCSRRTAKLAVVRASRD